MPRPRSWTDDDLRVAVATSRTLNDVVRQLGLTAGGATHATLRRHITRLRLDVSHLPVMVDGRVRRPRSWSDEALRRAVIESCSIAEVMRRLGYRPSGGMHRFVSAHIRRLNLDTSHFTGQAWAR